MPDALHDELLFGWLGRQRWHMGMPSAAAHMAALFGERSAVPSPTLQGRLGVLAGRLGVPGLGARELLLRHTLFPYYTAYQDPLVTKDAERDLVEHGGGRAFMRLGLAAFSLGPRRGELMVCPDCHAEQLRAAGRPTWLRSHQLPGSMVCGRHGAALVAVPTGAAGRHEITSPPLRLPGGASASWDHEQGALLRAIATAQEALLRESPERRPLAAWKPFYRELLASRGLMRSASKADRAALGQAVGDVLGSVLPLLPAGCQKLGEEGWPALMVREHRKAMHPLFHVLMTLVIAGVPMPRKRRTLTSSPRRRRGETDRRRSFTRRPRVDWPARDLDALARLREAKERLLGVTPLRQVTFGKLEKEAFSPGWLRKREHVLPRSNALASQLAEGECDFLDRRLLHWSQVLGDVPDWQICRAAGLRHERWPEARSRLRALATNAGALT